MLFDRLYSFRPLQFQLLYFPKPDVDHAKFKSCTRGCSIINWKQYWLDHYLNVLDSISVQFLLRESVEGGFGVDLALSSRTFQESKALLDRVWYSLGPKKQWKDGRACTVASNIALWVEDSQRKLWHDCSVYDAVWNAWHHYSMLGWNIWETYFASLDFAFINCSRGSCKTSDFWIWRPNDTSINLKWA